MDPYDVREEPLDSIGNMSEKMRRRGLGYKRKSQKFKIHGRTRREIRYLRVENQILTSIVLGLRKTIKLGHHVPGYDRKEVELELMVGLIIQLHH